ncbi:hypothetical protein HUG10_17290 [Halorarum halophilum]|uniref:Uncharacterized protein n=1 Tax=Halorarum halophilum TaxID=2743090 RepID=A0A7D5KHI2_9EURY|nr:DUF5781 family protein [Halobaculum halophilum]QLG29176.1 hypothetical protein HUG10_17290 [Halobaculum halophilum]
MDVRLRGDGPIDPFLGAASLFETELDLDLPVEVRVREDPEERTWAGHYDDRHVLNISRKAATSAMARELALHEFAHMARYEEEHPSHVQSTEEALFLALSGRSVERRKLSHCYQIANHMKDIYADDITLTVGPSGKLVTFFESQLAAAVADRPREHHHPDSRLLTGATDPDITVVNAAFALAMCERHDLVGRSHRLYDLAHAAADDAPAVDLGAFKRLFRSLAADPSASEYRKQLVDAARLYAVDAGGTSDGPAAAD